MAEQRPIFNKTDPYSTTVGASSRAFSFKVVSPEGDPLTNSYDKQTGIVNLGQALGQGYTPQVTSDVARSIMDILDTDSSMFDSNKPLNIYRQFTVIETMTQRVPEIFSIIRKVAAILTGSPIVVEPYDPTKVQKSTKEVDTLQFMKRNNLFTQINEWTLQLVTFGNIFLYFKTYTDKFFQCPHEDCKYYGSLAQDDLNIKIVDNSSGVIIHKKMNQPAARLKVMLIECPQCHRKEEHAIMQHPEIKSVLSEVISDNEGAHTISVLPLKVSDVELSKPNWYSSKIITVKFPASMNFSNTAPEIVRMIKQHDLLTMDAIINNNGSFSVEERNGSFNHANLAHFGMSDTTSTINNGWAIPTLASFLDDYWMLRYFHQADQANAIEHTNLMYLISPTNTDVSSTAALNKSVEAIRIKRAERGALIALSQSMNLTRLGGESKSLFTTELQDYITSKLNEMFGISARFSSDDFMFGATGADFHILSELQKFRTSAVNQMMHWVISRFRSQNESLRGLKDVEFHPLDTEKYKADVRELYQMNPEAIHFNAVIEAYGVDKTKLDKIKKEALKEEAEDMSKTISDEVADNITETGSFSGEDWLAVMVQNHLTKIQEITNQMSPQDQSNPALMQSKANEYLSNAVSDMNVRNAILGEFNRQLQASQQ